MLQWFFTTQIGSGRRQVNNPRRPQHVTEINDPHDVAGITQQNILPLVTAYCERVALRDEELDQLFDLIRTRLAMTLTVLYWRLSTRRQGDLYREKTLANDRGTYDFLVALDALGREAVTEQFKE